MPKVKKRKISDVQEGEAQGSASKDVQNGEPPKKKPARRELFVRGLAPEATEENFIGHFSDSFPVKHGVVVKDSATKACKGYGFITFADAEDAARAQEKFHNSLLLGRRLQLDFAEPRNRDVDDTLPPDVAAAAGKNRSVPAPEAVAAKAKRKADLEAKRNEATAPRLIIRNLPWSIRTEADLEKLFLSYGKVKHVVLPKKASGQLRGFGFVLLRGKPNAEKALKGVNGKKVDGRTIAVDYAVDKERWEQGKFEEHVDQGGEAGYDHEAYKEQDTAVHDSQVDAEEADQMSESDGGSQSPQNAHEGNGEDEDVDEASDEEETEKAQAQLQQTDRNSQSTLFVRNVPFNVNDEQLFEHFSQLGALRYARIVLDPSTERSRGTAFVCFRNVDDAKKCVRNAPTRTIDPSAAGASKSILQNEVTDPTGKYTLDGRVLSVTRAVSRSEAAQLASAESQERQRKDRRRLYLLNEGTINPQSSLYASLSPSERDIREASYKQRKQLIQNNPTLHLSLTRLSIRNLPRSVTSKILKQLAREAVVGFAKDVKIGTREKLSREELSRGGDEMLEAEKSRKQKNKGIVKQAKVVYETKDGTKTENDAEGGRSRGYGFVEYYTHRAALMGLRWLNGHAVKAGSQPNEQKGGKISKDEFQDRKKRIIAEFAIENAQVVHRRADRESRARTKHGAAQEETTTEDQEDKDVDRNVSHDEAALNETAASQKRQKIIAAKRAEKRIKRGRKA